MFDRRDALIFCRCVSGLFHRESRPLRQAGAQVTSVVLRSGAARKQAIQAVPAAEGLKEAQYWLRDGSHCPGNGTPFWDLRQAGVEGCWVRMGRDRLAVEGRTSDGEFRRIA